MDFSLWVILKSVVVEMCRLVRCSGARFFGILIVRCDIMMFSSMVVGSDLWVASIGLSRSRTVISAEEVR